MANDGDNYSKAESEVLAGNRKHFIIPLPFFFTKKLSHYFPLTGLWSFKNTILKTGVEYNKAVTITCKFSDIMDLNNTSIKLIYQGVCLDNIDRRKIHEGRDILVTVSQTHKYYPLITCENKDEYVKYVIPLTYDCNIKDIRMLIRSDSTNHDECLGLLNIRLHDVNHISLNALMARKIIPRRLYGILENKLPIYYIPFSFDPLAINYIQTTQIHFGRLSDKYLVLYLKPGNYNISLVAQGLSRLVSFNGECSLEQC
jgi:hypothetical protein